FLNPGLTRNLRYKLGEYGHMNTRMKELENYGDVDCLVIGASDAYRGFDPRIFSQSGIRIFNAGSSSQSPIQTEVLLNDCIKFLKPKRILYTVSHYTLTSDGVESAIDIVSNRRCDAASLLMVLKTLNIKPFNTMLYAIYRQVFGLDDDFHEPQETEEDVFVHGGFVQKKYSAFNTNSKMKLLGTSDSINVFQQNAFDRIVQIANENDVDLIFVKTPVAHYEQYCGLYGSIWEEVKAQLRKNGRFIDFNEDEMAFEDSLHFYDQYHLNQTGVMKFNAMVIDSLKK
ncbi:MAG: hypothetical protein ACKOW8_08900, partial [Flavobacteriales bacterium]